MASFARDFLDLTRGLIFLIIAIYLLVVLSAVLELGKTIAQFLQSAGFGALLVSAIVLLYFLFRESY